MYCNNCGNQLDGNIRFCSRCGAAIPESAGVRQPAQPQHFTEMQQPANIQQYTEMQQPANPQQYTEIQQPVEIQQYTEMQQPVEAQYTATTNQPSEAGFTGTWQAPVNTYAAPEGAKEEPLTSPRVQLEKTFSISRNNLLAVLAFTCINLVLALTNSDFFFLFSARIPLILLYLDAYEWATNQYSFSMFGIIAAFSSVSLYAIFWGVTKKYRGWIIAALVYFSIDILIMLFFVLLSDMEFEVFSIIEIAFMAWVMFYLISGTRAWAKLKKLQQQDEPSIYHQ